jgi:hypothetical protein
MTAKETYDFTDSVITNLNKNKGSEAVAAPAEPAAKAPKAEPVKKK